MGFEKFGKHGYVSHAKITPIIDHLEKGELAATQCKHCGSVYFPPRADCPKCHYTTIAWIPVDGRCNLIAFTEVHFAPPGFQDQTPYLLGLAELKSGQRVFAPIDKSIDVKSLRPGIELWLRPMVEGDRAYYTLEIRG